MRYVVFAMIGGWLAFSLGALVGGLWGFFMSGGWGWLGGIVIGWYCGLISIPIGMTVGLTYCRATRHQLPKPKDMAALERSQELDTPAEANDATFGEG